MRIIVDNMLRLQDIPDEILEQIKSELTIKNPEHAKKKAMGLNRWAWGPEYIKLWTEKTVNGRKQYILPRGYYARLWELTAIYDIERVDNRLLLDPIRYPNTPQLWDYQVPAVELAKLWQQGVVIMPCGSGKTETAMAIVAELEQPTLWITHTMDLLKQSMDRAISRLGLTGRQVGVIQGENMSIGSHMTFATVQTLARRDLSEVREKFGCIVVDECHLCFKDDKNFRMFADVISQLPAYYRFGLTASEHRSDGLIETMFHIIGPKFYEVPQDDPRLSVMTPRVEFIETDFYYEQGGELDEVDCERPMLSVQQMYKAMREDGRRNSIVGLALNRKILSNDYCLVLGNSLEHLGMLFFVMREAGKTAEFISGTTPKKVREKIMADMRAGKYQYLFATYQLAKLGLDIPRLNKLVLITPHRGKTTIQQAVGRIMRPFEGKSQPVVYDIYDSRVPQLVHWARERVRVYKRLGCRVSGGPVVRKW